jgi:hypothetical protein
MTKNLDVSLINLHSTRPICLILLDSKKSSPTDITVKPSACGDFSELYNLETARHVTLSNPAPKKTKKNPKQNKNQKQKKNKKLGFQAINIKIMISYAFQ